MGWTQVKNYLKPTWALPVFFEQSFRVLAKTSWKTLLIIVAGFCFYLSNCYRIFYKVSTSSLAFLNHYCLRCYVKNNDNTFTSKVWKD